MAEETKPQITPTQTPTPQPPPTTASSTNTSTTAATATPTPTPTYTTTPWATTPTTTIPYQHYQAYSSHYPQAAYGHYQYPAHMAVIQAQAQAQALAQQQQQKSTPISTPTPTQQPVTAAVATSTTASGGNQNQVDTTDVATLNDALGSAGVDLRAEEESLQRSHDQHQPYRPYEDRTRKQPPKPSFELTHISTKIRSHATSHKITRIPEDSINYIALALRARLQDLITAMIKASEHRTSTQFDRRPSLYPDGNAMWAISIRSDVAKQLMVLERVERDEEMKVRRERKERAEMTAAHAAALAAQANGAAAAAGLGLGGMDGLDDEGGAKKKRKKDGPGVTARNMSEDVRKKMSNAVATQAAGLGGKYAWMNAAATPAKPRPTIPSTPAPSTAIVGGVATPTASTSTPTPAPNNTASASSASAAASAASSWARPYVPTKKTTPSGQSGTYENDDRTLVTIRDAIFVIEKERGHGGGRGAARGFI